MTERKQMTIKEYVMMQVKAMIEKENPDIEIVEHRIDKKPSLTVVRLHADGDQLRD